MDLQACRLVAGRLADHARLDKITHDRHKPALGLLVMLRARKISLRMAISVLAGSNCAFSASDCAAGRSASRPFVELELAMQTRPNLKSPEGTYLSRLPQLSRRPAPCRSQRRRNLREVG